MCLTLVHWIPKSLHSNQILEYSINDFYFGVDSSKTFSTLKRRRSARNGERKRCHITYDTIKGFVSPRAHEMKQIPTGIAGLIDMVKKTSSGLVSCHLAQILRCATASKSQFFR